MNFSLPLGNFQWKPRDIAAGAAGVAGTLIDWGARGPFALLSFCGPLIKKSLISQDTPKVMKFLGGVLATLTGGVTGLLGYLAAAPRQKSEQEVVETRQSVVERRFGSSSGTTPKTTPEVDIQVFTPSKPVTEAPRRTQAFVGSTGKETERAPSPSQILATSAPAAGKTGKGMAAEWIATFDDLARNSKAWTISQKDDAEFHKWMGDTVRIVKLETDRLTAMMDEAFAALPASECKVYRDAVAAKLNGMSGSRYEKEKKFPKMVQYLEAAYQKVA